MIPGESAGEVLFREPLPEGFARRVYRAEPGAELSLDPSPPPDAILLVEQGLLEIECRSGGRCRFGGGALIPIARIPVARLHSVGSLPLVVAAIARER